MAAESSLAPSPFAPQSFTLMTSARRSGIVLAVGAPVAANPKFSKVVSACAARDGVNVKALTAPPNNTLRRMICGLIGFLMFYQQQFSSSATATGPFVLILS